MFISRLLLSGRYLKNGVPCSVGRRVMGSDAGSAQCSRPDSKEPLMSDAASTDPSKFFYIRVFKDNKGHLELSPEGKSYDKGGKLTRYLKQLPPDFKVGDAIIVTDVAELEAVSLACCGPKDAGVNEVEGLHELKENMRCWNAGAYKAVKIVSPGGACFRMNEFEANPAEEGYVLTHWTPSNEFIPAPVSSVGPYSYKGTRAANAQNWARHLSQMPTNKMTSEGVVQEAKNQLNKLGINVTSYDKKDIEAKKMSAFLAVAQGSSAPPVLLECDYIASFTAPLVLLVAKGLTFDSGGLCLKKPEGMLQHAGMTGAAVALGTMMGLASLKVKINVKLVVPLCENMISGQCLKVGDVVPTLKGLNVKVEDTDLEGHLMLADALTYGQAQYKPNYVMSVASLTPGIAMATGSCCYGCFTKNDDLWNIAREAGVDTGDRPWRFPIWKSYRKKIIGDTPLFDLKNRGSGMASHCIGAAFLDNFVTGDWLHYDITGVGRMAADEAPLYLDPNLMTGRPTRALIRAIIGMAKKYDDCPFVTSPTKDNQDQKVKDFAKIIARNSSKAEDSNVPS